MAKEKTSIVRNYGLIGKPLEHSFSPDFFARKFAREGIHNALYSLFPLDSISDFPQLLLNTPHVCGLNVTIPYKETIIPFLSYISPEAKAASAVNTIRIKKEMDGSFFLEGFNTDIPAFSQVLLPHLHAFHHTALIFGTGGAAKAVAFALSKLGMDYYFVSRKPSDPKRKIVSYSDLKKEHIASIKLLINTTPVGQFPNVEDSLPIDFSAISDLHILFDLIYNPPISVFLQKGLLAGATTINGLEMLELQAEAAWNIWNQKDH